MAGAWGGLAVLTAVTVRVAPLPRTTTSVLLLGLDAGRAVRAMGAALRLPVEVSGAAHLPDLGGQPVTALRLDGFPPSVTARVERLKSELKRAGELVVLEAADSAELWTSVGEVQPLAGQAGALWRIAVPPASGARLIEDLAGDDGRWLLDWGGGLAWLSLPEPRAAVVRAAAARLGGHATLVRSDMPAGAPAFHPEPPATAALAARVRTAFDPAGVLLDRRSASA
jgi:glycolate oxidase FAD binding subunit